MEEKANPGTIGQQSISSTADASDCLTSPLNTSFFSETECSETFHDIHSSFRRASLSEYGNSRFEKELISPMHTLPRRGKYLDSYLAHLNVNNSNETLSKPSFSPPKIVQFSPARIKTFWRNFPVFSPPKVKSLLDTSLEIPAFSPPKVKSLLDKSFQIPVFSPPKTKTGWEISGDASSTAIQVPSLFVTDCSEDPPVFPTSPNIPSFLRRTPSHWYNSASAAETAESTSFISYSSNEKECRDEKAKLWLESMRFKYVGPGRITAFNPQHHPEFKSNIPSEFNNLFAQKEGPTLNSFVEKETSLSYKAEDSRLESMQLTLESVRFKYNGPGRIIAFNPHHHPEFKKNLSNCSTAPAQKETATSQPSREEFRGEPVKICFDDICYKFTGPGRIIAFNPQHHPSFMKSTPAEEAVTRSHSNVQEEHRSALVLTCSGVLKCEAGQSSELKPPRCCPVQGE